MGRRYAQTAIMSSHLFQKVTCLGAGTIGSSWATFFAAKGFPVRLYDIDGPTLALGLKRAMGNLDRLVETGLLGADDAETARGQILAFDGLDEALDGVDFIQESVREDYAVKAELFRRIEPLIGTDTVIASSSSGLLITRMQSVLAHPERALIAHPFNPPHLIPLVELVPGDRTDPLVVAKVKAFFSGPRKVPVVLKK